MVVGASPVVREVDTVIGAEAAVVKVRGVPPESVMTLVVAVGAAVAPVVFRNDTFSAVINDVKLWFSLKQL